MTRQRVTSKAHSFYKCKACAALDARIYRLKSTLDFGVQWDSPADKASFYSKHKEAFGEGLRTALTQTLAESVSTKNSERLAEEGDWLDEEDLRERYKNKAEQLANVLQHARVMEHPVRKVKLYLDTSFRFLSATETERKEERKRETCAEEAQKAAPKPKKPRRDPTEKKVKELTEKQRAGLAKCRDKCKEAVEKEKLWLDTEGEDPHLPKPLQDAASRALAQCNASLAATEVALGEQGWAGSSQAVGSELQKTTKALQLIAKQMRDMLKMSRQLASHGLA